MWLQAIRESSTYQAILAQGRAEGLAEGRAEGRLATLRQILVLLLEQKFGSLVPSLEDTINANTDAAKLQAAILQVATINSPSDLAL